MQQALEIAGLNPSDIDFINTHGTATENNDEAESRAMIRIFGHPPAFASTKTYTGHTLGAANAVETIYGILSLKHQEVYPSLNFDAPIPQLGLKPVESYHKASVRHVMSSSFGFGGNCATVIVSKI
jgi:3-oxoacyl-(acyl-carrier-protein) synthase